MSHWCSCLRLSLFCLDRFCLHPAPRTHSPPPPFRLSPHPLIPLHLSDVPPSPRLWVWLQMCCPRRLVMLVLTALISVTANYVAVTASSHLRTATPPAIRPLSPQVAGALSDFHRLCRGTKPILGSHQLSVIASPKGVRAIVREKMQKREGGMRGVQLNWDPFQYLGI